MTINFTLDEKSIDNAIRLIEKYRDDLTPKAQKIVEDTSRVAENNARQILQDHIWSGETIQSLQTMKNKGTKFGASSTVMVGGAAIWLEFGTGVVANNCPPGSFIHPLAQELGMNGIGTYGAGHGSDPRGWYFDEGVWDNGTFTSWQTYHTFGIPATMFMYNSAKVARRYLPTIARGVFR